MVDMVDYMVFVAANMPVFKKKYVGFIVLYTDYIGYMLYVRKGGGKVDPPPLYTYDSLGYSGLLP